VYPDNILLTSPFCNPSELLENQLKGDGLSKLDLPDAMWLNKPWWGRAMLDFKNIHTLHFLSDP
jgi:hypothetical protein